jgi:hypothetical protein
VPDDSLLLFLCFTFFGQSEVGGLQVTSEGTAAEIKNNKITDRKKSRKAHKHNKKKRAENTSTKYTEGQKTAQTQYKKSAERHTNTIQKKSTDF